MAFSVSYAELNGYPRSGWQDGEFDAERRVLVAWSDRGTFLSELDAYPNCQYPYTDDGPANALVRRVRIHPFGKMIGSGSTASYDWSIVQIWHSTRGPIWDTSLGVFIDEAVFPAAQYKMVDSENLQWTDGADVQPDDGPRLDDTLYEYHVRYSRLTSLPAWVLTRPGVCNSNVVTGKVIPLSWAANTLKYNGCSISATYSLGTSLRYDVTAKFLFKSSGWNTFWRPDGGVGGAGGYEEMKTVDGTTYVQHTPTTINL